MTKLLIDRLQGKKGRGVPFWYMRQAGRYLPEYRQVRSNFPDFLKFCYHPEAACEVTLQPISRFNMSAAIIFSDILVIPDGLGMKVWFEEKIGPKLTPIEDLETLSLSRMQERLQPVYQAIANTRKALSLDKALFGFCGSPWTLACYMIEGKGSRDFQNVRRLAHRDKVFFTSLIALLVQAITQHASKQIDAGVDVIQLFDSWSGVLSEREFEAWVIAPTTEIIANLKAIHSHIPIIGFPRMSGEKYLDYAQKTKVDGVSIDGSISLNFAKNTLQLKTIIQGNLDSVLLAEDKQGALIQAKKILETLSDKPFIFNLAHGILPHTPLENVQALSELIKETI